MSKFVEYELNYNDINNWAIYFGFVKRFNLIFSKEQWIKYCDQKEFPQFYKKLTHWTINQLTSISIPENKT